MRITSRSAVSRAVQSESVAQSGSVPARVQSAAAAHNRKGPAKRSFRGVCPRVFPCVFTDKLDELERNGLIEYRKTKGV